MQQIIRFILAGGIAALANFGSRILFSEWLPYPIAIILAYLVGMVTAFTLIRNFVFTDAANSTKHQVLWFTLVNLAAIAQTLVISLLLARWLLPILGVRDHAETIAHAVGVTVPVVTSFIGHRMLSFRATQ